MEIVLRRAESAVPAPAPAAPPAADSIPAPTADTFYRAIPAPVPVPADADSDRVPDVRDVCLSTPAGDTVDASGCAPLFTPAAPVLTLRDVQFETGKAVMLPVALPELDSIARQLLALPDVAIEIAGHTDSSGVYRRNVVLAKARAETVRQYLSQQGVPLERMTARGFGPDRPVASNRTADGRALNRRVELRRRIEGRPVSRATPGPSRSRNGRSPARRRIRPHRFSAPLARPE
jgi:OOP family OmpA-OmpF porin